MSDRVDRAVDGLLEALNDSALIDEQHFLEGFLAAFLWGGGASGDPSGTGYEVGLHAAEVLDKRTMARVKRLEEISKRPSGPRSRLEK